MSRAQHRAVPKRVSRAATKIAPNVTTQTEEEQHYYRLSRIAWRLLAPFYDAITFPLRRFRDDVAATAGVTRGDRVLDVATGTGAQALAFAKAGAEVVGIDLSEAMLRIARKKTRGANPSFRQADASRIPFGDARFDVCCVSFGLHEMPLTVRRRVLAEMVRVTKADGTFVIVDYGLPEGAIARRLTYSLVRLYERDNYEEFIRSNLLGTLAEAGLAVRRDELVSPGWAMRWWSPVRVLVCSKSAPRK